MLSAIGEGTESADGEAVDWWFAYKLPHHVTEDPSTSVAVDEPLDGFNYLYYTANNTSGLCLSPNKLGAGAGALHNTLKLIFDSASSKPSSAGWLLYNDEKPQPAENDEDKGHCKGVLAFDFETNSAIWILHSTPRFPITGSSDFPPDEKIYAQTFLAITLKDVATANALAQQMLIQQDPQVYGYHWPGCAPTDRTATALKSLATGIPKTPAAKPSSCKFTSRGGQHFISIAKNRQWDRDFWIDLIGPTLDADVNIESWRRGKMPGTQDATAGLDVCDVGGIDLSSLSVNARWPYTRDHAKWASSQASDWVCVADINRQISQERRGGGGICFQHQELWSALSSIEVFAAPAR